MDKPAVITKTTQIEIPYNSVNLIDFTVSMSPSHLIITIKNKEEKTGVTSIESDNVIVDPIDYIASKEATVITNPVDYIKSKESEPVASIKNMVMDILHATTGWCDYLTIATRVELKYHVVLGKEQIRSACKRLRTEGRIKSSISSVDHKYLWMSVNDPVI